MARRRKNQDTPTNETPQQDNLQPGDAAEDETPPPMGAEHTAADEAKPDEPPADDAADEATPPPDAPIDPETPPPMGAEQAAAEPVDDDGALVRHGVGPMCPHCEVPTVAGTSGRHVTRFYCKNGKPGCAYVIKVPRESMRQYKERERERLQRANRRMREQN